MRRLDYYLSRPLVGIALGLGISWVYLVFCPPLAVAEVTIFFPPSLVLTEPGDKPGNESPEKTRNLVAWGEEALTSKQALDAVFKRIERSDAANKARLLRAAALLSNSDRLTTYSGRDSSLTLRVSAEEPATALVLCDGLLAYLKFFTKIPLEDPDAEKLKLIENQLRVHEKNLSRSLWGVLAFHVKPDPALSSKAEVELSDYQGALKDYLDAARVHFFRESRLAAQGPHFSVVEPPFAYKPARPWGSAAVWGGLLGLAFSFILQVLRTLPARRREAVPTFQEHYSFGPNESA